MTGMLIVSLYRCLFIFSAFTVPPILSWLPFTAFTYNEQSRREVRRPSIVVQPNRVPRSRGVMRDLRKLRKSETIRKASEDALEVEMATVMAMKVSEIKGCLSKMGIGTAGVYEVGRGTCRRLFGQDLFVPINYFCCWYQMCHVPRSALHEWWRCVQ